MESDGDDDAQENDDDGLKSDVGQLELDDVPPDADVEDAHDEV